MDILVDHKLRIAQSELPQDVSNLIEEALTIPNIERQKQMEQGIYGWQNLPPSIKMWEFDGKHLVLPRGFGPSLVDGLNTLGINFEIRDHRYFNQLPGRAAPIELRQWQTPAVLAIEHAKDGIYKAPAGSGKTVAVLEAVRRLSTTSIVIVNTKDILYQWVDRAKSFLGDSFPVGLIGDGHFQLSDYLTIATAQTLHSRFRDLEIDGFFDLFGFACLDECHHATAETYNRIVNRFSCRYRIGVSATPDKTGDFALATTVLGPIFHETKREDVSSLIDPVVFKIPTSFEFDYRGKKGKRPSNYPQLLSALIADPDRNDLIVKAIMIEEGAHALVISKRLEHLEILKELLFDAGYTGPVFTLTGKETSEERKQVVEGVSVRPCVTFSTLADEALDIPRLDCIFLVFPQRNTGLIEQQVGRVVRSHPDKKDAKIFDFCDPRVGPLDAQWRVRRLQVYQPHGYEIVTVNRRDILEFA
jgi:superfamily II DNA or RNA helicase